MAQSKFPKPIDEPADAATKKLPKRKIMTVVMNDGTVHSSNVGRPGLRRVFAAAHGGRNAGENEFDAYWMLWHAVGRPGSTGDDDADVAAFIDGIEAEDIVEEDVDLASTPTSPA